MIRKEAHGLPIYQFGILAEFPEVLHFATTRHGGVSSSPFESLNLGGHVSDEAESVVENRRRLADAIGVPLKRFVFCRQAHTAAVKQVDSSFAGRGSLDFATAIPDTDALITTDSEVVLTVLVADCVPILLFDPVCRVIANVHAGWRGTVQRVVQKTLNAMAAFFDSEPKNIVVGIGPSIGPRCYEVGHDVVREVENAKFEATSILHPARAEKFYFDLWEANRLQLTEMGVPNSSIEVAGICTHCYANEFFSERSLGRPTGRFTTGIVLRGT